MKISFDDRYRQPEFGEKWVGDVVPDEHWDDAVAFANSVRKEFMQWGVSKYIEVMQIRFVPNVLKKLELKVSHVVKMELPPINTRFDAEVEFHFGNSRKDDALQAYLLKARKFFVDLRDDLRGAASDITVRK